MSLQTSKQRSATLIVNRLGQTLDVNIFKLTVKETVEDRKITSRLRGYGLSAGILALQEQKRELASAALSGKAARNITKLTLNDLMGKARRIYKSRC